MVLFIAHLLHLHWRFLRGRIKECESGWMGERCRKREQAMWPCDSTLVSFGYNIRKKQGIPHHIPHTRFAKILDKVAKHIHNHAAVLLCVGSHNNTSDETRVRIHCLFVFCFFVSAIETHSLPWRLPGSGSKSLSWSLLIHEKSFLRTLPSSHSQPRITKTRPKENDKGKTIHMHPF